MCNSTEGKRAPDVEGREKGKVQTPWAATIVGRMECFYLLLVVVVVVVKIRPKGE
jgi:hypothetical protein